MEPADFPVGQEGDKKSEMVQFMNIELIRNTVTDNTFKNTQTSKRSEEARPVESSPSVRRQKLNNYTS